jgi:hypothetical protein
MTDRCRLAVELSQRQISRIQHAIGASREQIVRTTRVIEHSEQLLAGLRAPHDIQRANLPEVQSPLR